MWKSSFIINIEIDLFRPNLSQEILSLDNSSLEKTQRIVKESLYLQGSI